MDMINYANGLLKSHAESVISGEVKLITCNKCGTMYRSNKMIIPFTCLECKEKDQPCI